VRYICDVYTDFDTSSFTTTTALNRKGIMQKHTSNNLNLTI